MLNVWVFVWCLCVCLFDTCFNVLQTLPTLDPSNGRSISSSRLFFFECFLLHMVAGKPTSIALRTKWHHQSIRTRGMSAQMGNQHAIPKRMFLVESVI